MSSPFENQMILFSGKKKLPIFASIMMTSNNSGGQTMLCVSKCGLRTLITGPKIKRQGLSNLSLVLKKRYSSELENVAFN